MAAKTFRLAVLISGEGSNLQALIDACADPLFPAEIALVVSNQAQAKGLARAQAAAIPTRVLDHRAFPDRASFDAALDTVLREAAPDLVCLAGFMRLLTAGFVETWAGRMINIHPSLLPAFKGLNTHMRALEAGVKIAGCTVHFVTPGMDEGPILVQAAVPVLAGDTAATLAARVKQAEHRAYPLAVRLIAEGRVALGEGRAVVRGGAEAPASEILVNPLR
jgi:phosphoribosylglycinamide formyltransferase-1